MFIWTVGLLLLSYAASVSINCEEPPNITNGNVSITGLTPGSVATYSCASGYYLKGQQNRTCNFLGKWSSNEPNCGELTVLANCQGCTGRVRIVMFMSTSMPYTFQLRH